MIILCSNIAYSLNRDKEAGKEAPFSPKSGQHHLL